MALKLPCNVLTKIVLSILKCPTSELTPLAKTLPTLTNVDYVLRGYNILRGNPIATGYEADPGFDNTIFEAIYSDATTGDLRYRIPDGYSVFSKPICIIDFLSDYFVNEKTYQEELAVSHFITFFALIFEVGRLYVINILIIV